MKPKNLFIASSKIHGYDVVIGWDSATEEPGYFINYTQLCKTTADCILGIDQVLDIGKDYFIDLIGIYLKDGELPKSTELTEKFMLNSGIFFIIDDGEYEIDNGTWGPRCFLELFLMVLDEKFAAQAIEFIKEQIKKFNYH